MKSFAAALIAMLPALVAIPVWAETSEPAIRLGSKTMTVHQVKSVVGPSVQIDDQGFISAA
ncbi:MAG: hypothetical protein AAB308_07795, partial [Nitrospirota bacterium]